MSDVVGLRITPQGDVLVITSDEKPDTDDMVLGKVISSRPFKIEEEFAEELAALALTLEEGNFCGLEVLSPYFSLKMLLGAWNRNAVTVPSIGS